MVVSLRVPESQLKKTTSAQQSEVSRTLLVYTSRCPSRSNSSISPGWISVLHHIAFVREPRETERRRWLFERVLVLSGLESEVSSELRIKHRFVAILRVEDASSDAIGYFRGRQLCKIKIPLRVIPRELTDLSVFLFMIVKLFRFHQPLECLPLGAFM